MKKLKDKFSQEQIDLVEKSGFSLSNEKDYSDDDICDLQDKVYEYLANYGLADKGNDLNKTGLLCESIQDIISEL